MAPDPWTIIGWAIVAVGALIIVSVPVLIVTAAYRHRRYLDRLAARDASGRTAITKGRGL